jgi:conjugal transfer pilus assembly protein TraB
VAATPESRREVGRRNLNRQIAQRQKALLIGVGAIALVGGATFLFGGDMTTKARGLPAKR